MSAPLEPDGDNPVTRAYQAAVLKRECVDAALFLSAGNVRWPADLRVGPKRERTCHSCRGWVWESCA